MGYKPRSWGRFGRVPDPPEPPEDDDRKCMRCKHCIKREGPGWANPYGCDAWTCEFEEKGGRRDMKETKGHKSVMTLGMNMRYAPEIRPILLQIEVSQESGFKGYMTSHKTLSLTDEKTGAMLQAVITPEVEKILKELIG